LSLRQRAACLLVLLVLITAFSTVSAPSHTSPLLQLNSQPASSEQHLAFIDPAILQMKGEQGTLSVIVVFNVNPEEGCTALKKASGNVVVEKVYSLIPAALVEIPLNDVFKIAGLPEVESIWLNRNVKLSFEEGSNKGGEGDTATVNVSQIWSEGYNGSGVIVAVLDSGIDTSHPDLDDLDDDPSTNDSKVIASVSMVDYDPFPYDFNGHGTYVAGVVAGTGEASEGKYKGVAPGAMLMNVKVFDVEGFSLYSWILSGVEWSVSHGADVILIPFSIPGLPDDPLCLAVDAAARMGVTVVAASGDEGPAYMSIGSPGSALGAITVGAYNSSSGRVCTISGRGPTLYMWMKPDVVAPGCNVVSCRASPPDVGINISIPQFNLSGYGTPIDENYTVATTTAAAAAYVAGVSALLLQAFRYASPETIKISLLKTASDLGESPNVQGSGLVNPESAYYYLKGGGGEALNATQRTYTIGLPAAPLYVNNTETDITCYCVAGSSGMFTAMMVSNNTANLNTSHLIQGMFGVSYNGMNTSWLTMGSILRELHVSYLTSDYERASSIFQVGDLLVAAIFECWNNYTNHPLDAFKLTLVFMNTGDEDLSNLYLTFYSSPALFLNESDPSSDDHGFYDPSTGMVYVNDTYDLNPSQALYLGFRGNASVSGYEVGENETVFGHASTGELANTSKHTGNLGLAMKWLVAGSLPAGSHVAFTGSLSFGENESATNASASTALLAQPPSSFPDLCIVNASLKRLSPKGAGYSSDCLVLNVGNDLANASVSFFSNRSGGESTVYHVESFSLENYTPFTPVKFSVTWVPVEEGIYSTGWAIGEIPLLPLDYMLNITNVTSGNIQFNISEAYLLDNYLARNVFIGSPPEDFAVFPVRIPSNPFPINFPIDFAYYNLTVVSTGNLSGLKIDVDGNASRLVSATKLPETINLFGTIEIAVNTTTPSSLAMNLNVSLSLPFGLFNFPNPGVYQGEIQVSSGASPVGSVAVSFNVTYPQGRILFDSAHNLIDLEHLEEALDSTFTGYFSIYEVSKENGHELDEIPFIEELNETILQLYDTLIICDPELEFSQKELEAIESFVRQGGSLLVLLEPEENGNYTLINSLLEPYGIKATSNLTGPVSLTQENFTSHPVTDGVGEAVLYSPVCFQVNESLGAFTLTKGEAVIVASKVGLGRVVAFGDSDFASLSHIGEHDNRILISNVLEWLMENKLILNLTVSTPHENNVIYLGDSVYFLVHVTDLNGRDVSQNLTIFAIFNLPNGTSIPMWCFHYKDGLYTTLMFTEFTEQTGNYTLIVWADAPNYTSTCATYTFTVLPSPEQPSLFYLPSAKRDVLLGFAVTALVSTLIVGLYFVRRRRFQRRTFIPELDRELAYYMRNMINEVRAAFKELDTAISDEKLDDFEKIRVIHDKLPRLRRTLIKVKELAEKIGEY